MINLMNKQQLDKIFSTEYENIYLYANNCIKFNKLNYDPSDIVTESYLYVLNLIQNINEDTQVISYSKTFIKNQCKWNNGKYRRDNRICNIDIDLFKNLFYEESNLIDNLDSNINIDYASILEKIFSCLTSYEKRLYNIYFILKLNKGREIAEYLDISISGSYKVIKECKVLEVKIKSLIKKNIL